jgi:hypothetical protein
VLLTKVPLSNEIGFFASFVCWGLNPLEGFLLIDDAPKDEAMTEAQSLYTLVPISACPMKVQQTKARYQAALGSRFF